MEFGEKIATLRKSKSMTQAELGSELNVTFQAVSKWERGESLPDFATMSKISKLFGVPLEYFDEGGENAVNEAAAADAAVKEDTKPMLGVCKVCGKAVFKGEEFLTIPSIVCKSCHDREVKEEQRKKAEAKENAERKKRFELQQAKRRRNTGLIAGGASACALLIIFAISAGVNKDVAVFFGGLVVSVFAFTFISQMVWDGVVRTVCCEGGKIIGTPGVIFTLDLDGFIFLIAVKILFAVLKFLVFLLTSVLFVLVAILISPFTFVPSLLSNIRKTA